MIEMVMFKGFLLWLTVFGSVVIAFERKRIVKFLKELFGGYFGIPPKDESQENKDKD